ncbi:MAG: hypothetical protein HPY66_0543 [Firmicutes bacterium]|nr:hypothetical protein [Bacillota bacterium]MDI6704904.1 hypothetical protein [Bacillota bacterium]
MKFKKPISILVLCIAVLSLVAAAVGILSNQGPGQYEFESIHGETVTIYGKGIYQHDSIAVVAQGIAQDIATMLLGVPVLIISLYLSRKGLLKGRLLLTGTLGYFLYTYISYAFLWMYNPLFLVYVILMSASFFAFILSMMSFDIEGLRSSFNEKLPVKFVGGFQIFIGAAVGMLWLGRIIPPLINNTIPFGLEHYTTLVIQAMDLGFIVPAAVLSGVLILKRKPFGYLLSSVIIMKGITMLTSITAMIIGQAYAGVPMSFVEMAMFPLFNLITIYCLVLILKNIDEKGHSKII